MKKITSFTFLWTLLFLGFFGSSQAQCNSSSYNSDDCGTLVSTKNNSLKERNQESGFSVFYLRSQSGGEPWDNAGGNNQATMDVAFGGNWSLEFFEIINPNNLFSIATFIFLEGSDDSADALATFLQNNQTELENWVAQGGKLIINAAPNQSSNIDFGFGGTTLVYNAPASNTEDAEVINLNHPAFIGPNTPTSAIMSGNSYAHSYIQGTGYTNLMWDVADNSRIILAEKYWGAGIVMVGGMTTTNFHTPATESSNWRSNLYTYIDSFVNQPPSFVCSSDITLNNDPGVCGALLSLGSPTVTDPEGEVLSVTQTPANGTTLSVGANLITWSVTDAANNTVSCSFTVTVVDAEAPVIDCPNDITVNVNPGATYELPDYIATNEATVIDNCPDNLITSQNPTAGTLLSAGTYTINIIAEDNNNQANCSFTLVVDEILGVNDSSLLKSIAIYPNPTSNDIVINNGNGANLNSVKIYDITGRLVMTENLSNMNTEKTINISQLSNASYLLVIEGEAGKITKQLVKN